MTSILITGSNGFIGSSLALKLLQTNCKVTVINRSLVNKPKLEDFANFYRFLYDGSSQSIQEAVVASEAEICIHLASYFIPRHTPDDVSHLIASNITFPTQLLESSSQFGVTKFINTRTFWQHYQDSDYDPVCLYAATKQAFEDILTYYVNSQKIDAITLKLFDTYGKGDTRRKVLNLLVESAISGEELKLSPCAQKLNLVHVEDVVSAYQASLDLILNRLGFQHSIYGVAHSEVYTLRELADLVEKLTGKKIKAQWGALPYRDREVMVSWSRYTALPNWQPKISLPTSDFLQALIAEIN